LQPGEAKGLLLLMASGGRVKYDSFDHSVWDWPQLDVVVAAIDGIGKAK